MASYLSRHFDVVSLQLLIVFVLAGGVIGGLLALDGRLLLFVTLGVVFCGWLWIVQYDHVTAFAVFFALTPLLLYVRFLAYPPISVPGTDAYILTLSKEVLLVTLFGHWLFTRARSGDLSFTVPRELLILYMLLVGMLMITAPNQSPLLMRPYVQMFVLIAIPLLSYDLSRRDIQTLLLGFLVAGAVLVTVALYHYFVDPTFMIDGYVNPNIWISKTSSETAFYGPRLQSITANPNNLGVASLITSIVALYFVHLKEARTEQRVFAATVLALSSFVVLLTRSRDDIVLLALAFGLFSFFLRNRRVLIFGLLGGTTGLLYKWEQVTNVFLWLVEYGNPRIKIWLLAFDSYGLQLVTGGSTVAKLPAVDSVYLQLLINVGVIGAFLFVLMNVRLIGQLLRRGYHQTDSQAVTIAVALIVLLGVFAVGTQFYNYPFNAYYWAFLALGIATVARWFPNREGESNS